MSGHSKWATIHRQKEVKDTKRGAIFTKLGQAITIAVRQGGGVGDPDKNFKLRLAIEKARAMNMPKENIQRAIDRGAGAGEGELFEEVMFEGFLPGGAAVLVHALTDNKLRTAQQVREVLDKNGGSMGGSGAVSYLFSHKGEIVVKVSDTKLKNLDDQELEIIDLGVEDIKNIEDKWVIYCEKDKTFEIKEKLGEMGYEVESAELTMKPMTEVEIGPDEPTREKIANILDKLEDLDGVQEVWTNLAYA